MKKTFIKKGIFACIAAILGIASSFAQTITNVAVDASACTGRTVSVSFTPTGFTAGAEFTAQLSDASGTFTTPVELGKATGSPIVGNIPSASVAGTSYKVRVISVTPAINSSASGNLSLNTTPPLPTGQNSYHFCVGDPTIKFSANGENLKWYALDGTVLLSGAPSYTTESPVRGHTPYSVSQTVNGCESGKLAMIISGNLKGESPIVTNPGPICQNLVVSSNILSSAIKDYNFGDFIWDDSPTLGSPQAVPTPSTSVVGTRDYFVTRVSFNGITACASPKSKVTVTILPAPATPTVMNRTVLKNSVSSPLTVTGTTGTLKWYETANNTTPLGSAPIPPTSTVGNRSYFVSQTVGDCESARAELVVTVNEATCTTPAAPVVVTPLNYIVGQAGELTATAISGATLSWYGVEQTGGTASSTKPILSTAAVGSITYYVSQSVDTCESPRSAIVVNVTAAPCTTPAAPVVVTPLNYTVGQTAQLTATAISGATLNWYGTNATGGTSSPTKPVPSTAAVGALTYYVSQIIGTCESTRSAIVVNVTAAPCTTPAAPVVVTPLNYTVGQAAELTATAILGATLNWYGTNATGGTSSLTKPVPSTTAISTATYYVSQSVGTCESPRAAIVVNVTAAACATPAPAVANVTYCFGETAVVLTATGTALKWYGVATGGTALASAPLPVTTTAGIISYYVSQTVGGCEGPRAKIDVTVNPQTAAPTVVSPVGYIIGATNPVALTATGTSLKWYTVATGGTALAEAPVPSTATMGIVSYYVSQTLNGCEGLRAKIDVVVSACATLAPTVASITYCFNETPVVLTATGTSLKWYTAATGGTALASAPLPVTSTAGITSYYVSQTVGGCEGPRAKIDVTVNPQTLAPTVVSPVNYTIGGAAPVVLTATGTLLKWYTVATGGTALAGAPVPVTTTAGTVSYYVSQTINGCESLRAKIDVVVSACTTPAPTVANVTYCPGETAATLTATGTALKWYNVATGGVALASAPQPVTTTAGVISYYVSQTVGGCEGPRAKIDVTVNPQTALPTVANVTYCLLEPGAALTATGNSLKWYSTATSVTALPAAPVPSTTTAGTTSYYVSQTVNGCEGLRAKIDVIVNPQTTLPTFIAPLPYCFNQTATPLTATGTGLKWYSAATGGTALGSAPVPATTAAGTISYYVSQTVNSCEGLRAKIDVIVKPQVPAPIVAAAPIEYCQSVKALPLTATVTTGSTLSWYGSNATGGTASGTAPTPSTETEGSTSYYVNQTDVDGCISPRARIDVKINVTPKPAVATPSVAYCQNEKAPALSASGSNLKWYLTLEDTNPRSTALVPFTEKVSDYSFYVTQTGTNTCESPKAEIKVHIKPLPSATISGNSSIALGQTTNITVNFTGDGPWKYTLSTGQTATTNDATIQVPVSPATTTSYVITEVSNVCGKGVPNGIALVTVLVPTITTGIPSVSQICAGRAFTVQFQQSGSFPTGNAFTAQISTTNDVTKFASVPSAVNGNVLTATVPDTVKAGSYFIRIVSAGRDGVVPGSVSSGKITINPLPVATITGPATILQGQAATLNIAITGDTPWTFSFNDGAKDSLISSSVSPVTIRVTPKTTTVYQITSISNGCGVGRGAGTLRVQVDPVLGTEPPVVAADWLKIYPTMIDNNKCIVEITNALSTKEAMVEIIDLAGRSLSKSPIRQKVTEVDFSSKPSGMYLLKVQNGDRISVQRIFKQ